MFCVSLCEWMAQMYGLVYLKEHLPEKIIYQNLFSR